MQYRPCYQSISLETHDSQAGAIVLGTTARLRSVRGLHLKSSAILQPGAYASGYLCCVQSAGGLMSRPEVVWPACHLGWGRCPCRPKPNTFKSRAVVTMDSLHGLNTLCASEARVPRGCDDFQLHVHVQAVSMLGLVIIMTSSYNFMLTKTYSTVLNT